MADVPEGFRQASQDFSQKIDRLWQAIKNFVEVVPADDGDVKLEATPLHDVLHELMEASEDAHDRFIVEAGLADGNFQQATLQEVIEIASQLGIAFVPGKRRPPMDPTLQ